MTTRIPNVLSIAGTDPSGGAGIMADLKTFGALGAYGCGVVTAVIAQNTQGVEAVGLLTPDQVRTQIENLLADVRIDAIKIGMLGSAAVIETVADALEAHPEVPWRVLDPVMVASSGDRLLDEDAVDDAVDGDGDGYGEAIDGPAVELEVGDLLQTDESLGMWGVVEGVENDVLDDEQLAIEYRDLETGEEGLLTMSDTQVITYRRPDVAAGH